MYMPIKVHLPGLLLLHKDLIQPWDSIKPQKPHAGLE